MIDADSREFLEGGCALLVGTVDAHGVPHATRGWGLDVLADVEGRVRIILPGDDPVTLGNLRATGRLAATGTDVFTLRSIQGKGRVVSLEAATTTDRLRAERYSEALFGDIERVDATPRVLLERLLPRSYHVCIAVIEELYDQTPGPKAGSRVDATA